MLNQQKPVLAIDIELFNTSLADCLKREDTTALEAKMARVLTFCKEANELSQDYYMQTNAADADFFATLKKLAADSASKRTLAASNVATKIKERQTELVMLVDGSYLPIEFRKKFNIALGVRNEKEYYRQLALIVGAVIVFTFAPICFAFAATGHALYATAAAMVGIGLTLISNSTIKNKPKTTWYFDTLDGPKWDAKEFKEWVGNLDRLVTETIPKVRNRLQQRLDMV